MDIILIGAQGAGKGTQGEAVRRRLVVFFNEAGQVLDYYKSRNKLREVDGDQSIDQVQAMILQAVNDYLGQK